MINNKQFFLALFAGMIVTLTFSTLSWAAGQAGLRIKCDRQATIYLNGKASGQCPKNFALAVGSYEVVLKQAVNEDTLYYYKQTIDLANNAIEAVNASLVLTYTELGLRKYQEKKVREELAKQERERQQREDQAIWERLTPEERNKKILDKLFSVETMVSVKGGCFHMGDTFGEDDEKPAHKVCVDGFSIGKYEVTQELWQAVLGSNPAKFKSGNNYPVEQVSWDDTQKFLKQLNRLTGKQFRLPTEAEWEYAARSGGKKERYAGGDDIAVVAWYYDNSGNKTHPVGTKQPNGLGLFDMSGNVWEWCSDWHGDTYYSSSPQHNPKGPTSGSYRVFRGGSWSKDPWNARSANRSWGAPGGSSILGFRLVLPPGQQ